MVVMIIGRAGLILVERRNPMIAQCPNLPSPWWGARSLALTSHMQARFQMRDLAQWLAFADDAPVLACRSAPASGTVQTDGAVR